MHRTQLYLDDHLWSMLHARARSTGTTVSELVCTVVREYYLGDLEERRKTVQAIVGMWKDRDEFEDPEGYIRNLRNDTRLERLKADEHSG
ncbi:MAG: CopG family transcriptional regulator [Acidobacteriaceae bacterium]|nr:CopG family transcriptional regulator [Acidobacteriaceae bacterium]MBV9226938.1 CopG family transcriptional regulator [Acidobacteriaceae bacterium]